MWLFACAGAILKSIELKFPKRTNIRCDFHSWSSLENIVHTCTCISTPPHGHTHTRTRIILNRWWFQKCEWFSCVILFLLFSLLDTLFRSCYLIAYSFISTELFHRKTSTHSTPQMPRSQQIKINKCRAVYKWAILVRILNRTSVQWMSLNGANENYFIQIMKYGNAFEIEANALTIQQWLFFFPSEVIYPRYAKHKIRSFGRLKIFNWDWIWIKHGHFHHVSKFK